VRRVVAVAAFCLVMAACSLSSGSSSSSPSPSGSPLATSGQLDAQVPMPPSFPADVPIYPKARLTAAAGFPSSGPTSWGMEWETLDSVAKVQAYYAQNMNKGDWTITFTTQSSDSFAATFARRSNSHVNGTLSSNSASGVTKILMSLLSPSS
jgi:hypothetical protein